MRAKGTTARRGVTLVELLIVIAIIGILIGLLLPAISGARNRVREAQVRSDIEQLGLSVAQFKNDYKVPYFPSKIRLRNNTAGYAGIDVLDVTSFQYLKKLWPRLS